MCLAVPGKIIDRFQVDGLPMAKIDFGGVVREACLAYIPDARVGEYTVIHVGFAISRLSEEEALKTLDVIEQVVGPEGKAGEESDGPGLR
ncbi:MAG: HypC/HybG/HupF family hydrogenase formation chaperone [Rudaea sp.]